VTDEQAIILDLGTKTGRLRVCWLNGGVALARRFNLSTVCFLWHWRSTSVFARQCFLLQRTSISLPT